MSRRAAPAILPSLPPGVLPLLPLLLPTPDECISGDLLLAGIQPMIRCPSSST